MNPFSSSSSSSSSTPNSGCLTPSSRATSPSSEKEGSTLSPSTYVYTAHASPEFLTAVFDKHVDSEIEHVLGVIFDNEGTLSVDDGHWHQEELAGDTYYTTSFPLTADILSDASVYIPATEPSQARHLLTINLASLRSIVALPFDSGKSTLYIVERPSFTFPPLSKTPCFQVPAHLATVSSCKEQQRLQGNIPTLEEWDRLWAAWDMVTLQMIPSYMLHQKPIDLRHKCLFYIGHIPTFLDMLLHKSIGGGPSEPAYFWKIFERGIDPHVDDPDHCHNHSEVPEKDEDWPTIETIITFRDNVRRRLKNLYGDLETGKRVLTRNIARTLVMTYEHEGWHIETLLYMLLQRAGSGTRPPYGFTQPAWSVLSSQWSHIPLPETPKVTLGPCNVVLGHNDSEALDKLPSHEHDVHDHVFGWDNESPARTVHVKQFKAEWRPITNGEFKEFMEEKGQGVIAMPKSWVEEDGEIKVRTMFGPVPLAYATSWPVLTSYDDLSYYAKCKGGRLPTEPELRIFLDTYDVGLEEGANVGFRHWHPTPATAGHANGGKGSNGGIWEWTSTMLDTHEELAPTDLFTGYSTDFFDSKHQVVLGASYATIPRLAGRRTVRNFYQHNYPYPWVGARVVYDL
ncbi:hypothetical protein AGABI1DRAFT_112491 [Agaricus bisporus var. burnettii JB137-S8]|uniref:Sulfatase-modifying factor enzyme-like domain-containing protein n=1 Tax=Agaricus bisporus var. burnettii (strain JB137-S8 / ATCC MYA-4627 / FGSC 10392) TaxID=597362 RepID=K5WZ09_AGABU|nr:uncharacterized protein AGABI1DRAFT_112491 [Agaricus bisporus var. burnettii JB137-S8]EKM80751.1 hypothetical protein AGABI1DRAFT_112491 [Agaricus bisporus var. burnettii JB137-S8]